jgi:universal stress protein A
VLCPVDFSDASRVALRYAAAVATHFKGRLTLLTVNDPILSETADLRLGPDWLKERSQRELASLVSETFAGRTLAGVEVRYEVATGKAAPEILRVARDAAADLIVMSSHGLSGFRKLFFGATTERVLRETTVPVLVTPATGRGPTSTDEAAALVRRILVPVDLVTSPAPQVGMAELIASALGVPIVLAHVIEPLRSPAALQAHLPNVDAERRTQADQALAAIAASMTPGLKVEGLTAYGDSAEEIAKIARDRQAGLIVMGLHASPVSGSRMGSVTYRVLCLARILVLALPPRSASPA